jgi:uncharacterized membrane protein
MFYVGLYQSRVVRRIWCPAFGKGCEAVADAPFARPFGIPDGHLGAALYLAIVLLLLGPVERLWVWVTLLILCALAVVAGIVGLKDMAWLGHFCFHCLLTACTSPLLGWMVWRLH